MNRFFATASRGTEKVLADELRGLGIAAVEERRGGVAFGARLEDAYRACLWSRVANRVLLPLSSFDADDAGTLYDGARAIDWSAHLGCERTLAVDVAGRNAPAGPTHFVTLKVKDAIVDRVREAEGERPNIDTRRPDVRINVHLAGPRVTVSLDLSGGSLHRRGIGRPSAEAPLKENLAAAMLKIAGWPGDAPGRPLFDPFCGSGTIIAEAASMALDVAPGLGRRRLGAEGWRGHDPRLWRRILAEARDRRVAGSSRKLRIAGSDASPAALDTALRYLEQAGLERRVRLEKRQIRDVEAPWADPGLVVTNPPYGERIGDAEYLEPLYGLLGDVLKRRFPGWATWILCGNPALAKRIGLKPAARHVLYNGPIECRMLEIPISAEPVLGENGPGWRRPRERRPPD